MKILLHWLFGYVVFKVKYVDLREIFNFANTRRIQILNVKEFDDFALVRIYAKHAPAFENLEVVYFKGLPRLYRKYSHRVGFWLGIISFFAILYFSPKFVWEIKVKGFENLSNEEVIKVLNDAGIEIGSFSPSISRSDVYSKVILENKDISWISVNFIGSTANVEIIEREYTAVSESFADGANIIASCDGQIVDTDIKNGRRIVNDGDVVKKGDLLVSGIYDSLKAGTRIVYSDAKVYARVTEEFLATVPLKIQHKVYNGEDIANINIKLFKNNINIFKKSPKTYQECDTIIREESIPLNGLERLPVTIEKTCCLPYVFEEKSLTEEEALLLAKNRVANMISSSDFKEIISVTDGYYIENEQLHLHCEVEAVKNIAFVNEFRID